MKKPLPNLMKTLFLLLFVLPGFVGVTQVTLDAGIIEIYTPLGSESEGDTIAVNVELKNFGADTLYAMDIAFVLNAGTADTTAWTGILLPGDSDSITLSSVVIPFGNSTICAFSILAGDSVTNNDTLCKAIVGNPLNDAGIASILELPQIEGTYPVYTTINNLGVMELQSVVLEWMIDTIVQTSVNWSGMIAPGMTSEPILLGSYAFADSTIYSIKVNTSLPNGTADLVNTNDTLLQSMEFFYAAAADTFPYCESYEVSYDAWLQNSWDDFDWTQDSNGTPSNQTGPGSAFDGTFYMYAEASNPQQNGDIASLEAMFDLTNNPYPEISFYYHMYGTQMGTLHMDIYDSIWHEDVWVMSGNQGNSWYNATVDVLDYGGDSRLLVRFRAQRGSGSRSDMAIDLFCINELNGTDVGVAGLNSGSGYVCAGTAQDFSVEIENLGAVDQNLIPLELVVEDPLGALTSYFDTIIVNVPALTSYVHTFNNINISQSGIYVVGCTSSLAGDSDTLNNSLSTSINTVLTLSTFPFVENFEAGNSYFMLLDAQLAAASIYTDTLASNTMLRLTGGGSNQGWSGTGNNVSPQNAWVDNVSHQASAITCAVDASSLLGLMMDLDLRQTNTFGYTDYCWFRVLVNDTIQIADVNGVSDFNSLTSTNDPFGTVSFNLSAFAGTQFTITLQASVKYNQDYNANYPDGDQALIDNINLYEPVALDAGVIEITAPIGSFCGTSIQYIDALIGNFGISTIDNFPVHVIVTSSTGMQTLSTNVLDTMQNGDITSISVGPFDMSAADTYYITVQTGLLSDGNVANDMLNIMVSTVAGIGSFPFMEDFVSAGTDYFSTSDNNLATVYYFDDNGDIVLRMEGGPTNAGWSGSGNGTLPQNAWVDNVQHHGFANSCTIDATGLPFLHLDIDFRQTGILNYLQYSWFRVLINDTVQLSDMSGTMDFNPIQAQGDPYAVHTFDLSTYAGTQFTLTLQSSCKYDSTLTTGGTTYVEGDAVYIRNISLFEPPAIDIYAAGILGVPEPDCSLPASPITAQLINKGTDTLFVNDTIPVLLGVNSVGFPEDFILSSDMAYGDTAYYTFTTVPSLSMDGVYQLSVYADYPGDGNLANNQANAITTNILSVDSYPYFQDFDMNADGWHSYSESGNIDWELGTPAQTVLAGAYSGISAWMTDLDANYPNFSESYLYTPCFDFSMVNTPLISFWINFDLEEDYDGMILEGSADNGLTWMKVGATDPTFYNSFNNNSTSPVIDNPWWSGTPGAWMKVSTIAAVFAGEPNVKFRFRFESDNTQNAEGAAIDDFYVEDLFQCDASSSPIDICEGESALLSVALSGGSAPFTYSWSPVATLDDPLLENPTATPIATTNYGVTVTDSHGTQTECNVVVNVLPAPVVDLGADFSTSDSLVVLDGGAGNVIWTWSTGASTQTIEVTTSGTYSVFVIDQNGCEGTDEITITFLSSINESENSLIKIYPNPANEQVFIELVDLSADMELYLSDVTGKILSTGNIPAGTSSYELEIAHLAAGTYFISLRNSESIIVRKLLIE
jgi:hypothetical protein